MKPSFKLFSRKPSVPAPGLHSLAAQALDVSPSGTLLVNAEGIIVYASQPITRLLGWHTTNLIDKFVVQLFPAADQQKLQALWYSQSTGPAAGLVAQDIDIGVFNNNQQVINGKISVAHLDWQGRPYTCLSLRFAKLEDLELRLAREQALEFKQASQNKSRFLANISHEIRTPLNGVLGMIDLLASSPLNSSQRDHLSSLKKSSRNLRALTRDVLDFSKIEAGMIETERVPFDLMGVLGAVIQSFTPTASAKGVVLQLEPALTRRDYIGDPHRLSQVLNNLVSNALKFTASGSVKIAVFSRMLMTSEDLCRLTISVTDTGEGIQPEQLTELFREFHQTSNSISRHHGGTGLGLFICRELVRLMGGEISVRSQPGEGSTFEFWIDLQTSHSPPPYLETAPPARLETLAGARILVVEDDLTNQVLLQAWLEQAEAVTVCRSNGQEALDELSKESYFDAVLMDVSMSIMDGLAATRRIRQPQPQDSPERQRYLMLLPVIGITGHVFSEDLDRCFAAGMTDILTKPLSRVALLQKLTSALETQHLADGDFC